MTIYRISLTISGRMLSPKKLENLLICEFKNKTEVGDISIFKKESEYGFVTICHPDKYAIDYYPDHENWIIDYLEKNYESFKKVLVEDIEICYNIFSNSDTLDFAFNSEILNKINKFNVSLLIEYVKCSKKKIFELMKIDKD